MHLMANQTANPKDSLSSQVRAILTSLCCHPKGSAGFVSVHRYQALADSLTMYNSSDLFVLRTCQPGSAQYNKLFHYLDVSLPFQGWFFL